jgi:hypothetical protein
MAELERTTGGAWLSARLMGGARVLSAAVSDDETVSRSGAHDEL